MYIKSTTKFRKSKQHFIARHIFTKGEGVRNLPRSLSLLAEIFLSCYRVLLEKKIIKLCKFTVNSLILYRTITNWDITFV